MTKLLLYTVFHANLNFSRIPADLFPQILRNSYWPLLRIIEEQRVPMGLEMSGHTLSTVNAMDPGFTQRLRRLWEEGLCEFVGSGYLQTVMPLIPARANRENLKIGNEIYQELLGREPDLAFLNEQVHSWGLNQLYQEAGYTGLVANWDSSGLGDVSPDLAYRPCAVTATSQSDLPVIWHSQVASREFQQFSGGNTPLESFVSRLADVAARPGQNVYPLYTSDWEVFDFVPWEPVIEGFERSPLEAMDRVSELFSALRQRPEFDLVTPSTAISKFPELPLVELQDAAYPITYKKQAEHSMGRWAVGGRDGVRINTQCHQLYEELVQAEGICLAESESADNGPQIRALWKDLCYLWGSDFRTFTTDEKHVNFQNLMGSSLRRVRELNRASQAASVETDGVSLEDRSGVAAEDVGSSSPTVADCRIDQEQHVIDTGSVRLQLSPDRGGTIASLEFPQIADGPLTSPVEGLPADARHGGLDLTGWTGQSIDDDIPTEIQYPSDWADCEPFLPVRCVVRTEEATVWKTYKVYRHQPRVDITYRFQFQDMVPQRFRVGRITLNSGAFDRESLFYATVNGGYMVERFLLNGHTVRHDDRMEGMEAGGTSRACLGATEGWVVIGDAATGLGVFTRKADLYSAPMVRYEEQTGKHCSYSLSLVHTLGELDDTSHTLWRGHSAWAVSILGGKADIVERTRSAALLASGSL